MYLDQFRTYTAWHDLANRRAYEAPADPWALLRVDPTAIAHHTQGVDLQWGLGRVTGGNWDRPEARRSLTDTAVYEGLVQRFDLGADWTETALYQRAAERFAAGNQVRGYESLEEYRRIRCGYLDDLFRTIDTEGYRPNAEADHVPPVEDNPFEGAYVHHLEPLVVIARDGSVILAEGFHRVAIAAVLELKEIPVQVLCRHVEWQRVRDRLSTGRSSPDELPVAPDHPDLRDLHG